MAGYLTTHVLDTSKGIPAAGLEVVLYRVSGNSHRKITSMTTNDDGRTDSPILPEDRFKVGEYELIFKCGDYLDDTSFLQDVPLRFTMSEDTHYHVPLLLSPFGYSTYRGS
ncbi:MAG: hydroxyisourate hydrolase [Litoreibacter sp.]